MANDGGIIIPADFDTAKAEAKIRKLQREFDISKQKAENIKNTIKDLNAALEVEKEKQEKIRYELEEQNKEAGALARKIDKVKSGTATQQEIIDLGDIRIAERELQEMEKAIQKNEQAYAKADSEARKITAAIAKQNIALKKQNSETANIGDQILLNGKKQNKFSQSFEKSAKSAERFGRRLKSLIASALFFSLVTKAFTALRNEFGKLITETGTKSAALVAQLNGSLAVLGRTLYEGAKPYIEWILQALIKMVNILAQGLAKILGKDINQMKKLAEQTKKAGEEAKKATAGFDTLQTIDTSSNSSNKDSGVGTDFSALTSGIDSEVALLMTLLSGALLVLGVILAFTGVNIPLGIGLIIAGAVGLATTYATSWNTLSDKTKDLITKIMAFGGLLLLILGLILLFTGAGIPLGIGLILLGATSLGLATALSPGDTIVEKVKNVFAKIKSVFKAFFDWASKGLDVVFGEGVGNALELMFDAFVSVFEDIITFFVALFTGDWERVWKSLVNIVIDILNILIGAINLVLGIVLGGGAKLINLLGKAFGADWKLNADWAQIPKIPRLATGAVLPGGSPMLAWVNDQPKGQPYVEGSIENIAAAFEKYLGDRGLGNQNITIEANGNWAQFIKWMNLEIKKENNRATLWG